MIRDPRWRQADPETQLATIQGSLAVLLDGLADSSPDEMNVWWYVNHARPLMNDAHQISVAMAKEKQAGVVDHQWDDGWTGA